MSKKPKHSKQGSRNTYVRSSAKNLAISRSAVGESGGSGLERRLVTLKIQAPFLFPGISAGRYGLDRTCLRDWRNRLAIPQDQVRGVARHGLEAIGRSDLIAELFGRKSGDVDDVGSTSFEPHRGRLHFSDLTCSTSGTATLAHRVQIDEMSGAAKEGHLLVIEQPVGAGRELAFSGEIVLVGMSERAAEVFSALELALKVPLSIGAMKSVGFGRITAVSCASVGRRTDRKTLPKEKQLVWRFTLDRPYLVNAMRVANNSFVGQPEIPGGALKGALAETLRSKGYAVTDTVLSEYLSRMKIGTARALGAKPPLAKSIVFDRSNQDFANLALPDQVAADPVLRLDWKAETELAIQRGFLDQEAVEFEERVHTEINPVTGAASDQMLYSTVAVHPGDAKGITVFGARLELPEDMDTPPSIRQALESVLIPLGRTSAIVSTEGFEPRKSQTTARSGRIAVRLMSSGLLADPFDDCPTEAESAGSMIESYRTFWAGFLPDSRLLECFAGQSIAGGYLAKRYAPRGTYRPWILTEAGSIFVFDIAENDVGNLNRLLASGVNRPCLDGADLTWQNCPFVSGNGFGELEVYSAKPEDQSTW